MIKKIILLILALSLTGCQFQKKTYPNFTVMVFYLETCGHCQAFKENAIPLLEKTFDDAINIEYYDMDNDASQEIYHNLCQQLYFYDEEFLDEVPFFVMKDEFALLGYSEGEEKELVKDIKRALDNQPLGERLSGYRWEFE